MPRRALRLLALLLGLAPAAVLGQGLDVLALYGELQVAQPNGFPHYEVTAGRGGARVSGDSVDGPRTRVDVLLDQPHAFLRLVDRGEGDGARTLVTEVVAWIDPEGAPLVGLSEWGSRGGVPFGGRLRFYSRLSGRWNLVTAQVWPSLDTPLCGTPPEDVTEEAAGWDGLGALVALLPRTGTDVAAWCVGSSPRAGTGAMVMWERARGVFQRGAALAGPPSWPLAPSGR